MIEWMAIPVECVTRLCAGRAVSALANASLPGGWRVKTAACVKSNTHTHARTHAHTRTRTHASKLEKGRGAGEKLIVVWVREPKAVHTPMRPCAGVKQRLGVVVVEEDLRL